MCLNEKSRHLVLSGKPFLLPLPVCTGHAPPRIVADHARDAIKSLSYSGKSPPHIGWMLAGAFSYLTIEKQRSYPARVPAS